MAGSANAVCGSQVSHPSSGHAERACYFLFSWFTGSPWEPRRSLGALRARQSLGTRKIVRGGRHAERACHFLFPENLSDRCAVWYSALGAELVTCELKNDHFMQFS